MKIKNVFSKIKKASIALVVSGMLSVTCFAENYIADSDIGNGLVSLLNDLSGVLMGLGAAVAVISAIILLIKKAMAQANDQNAGKNYNSAILVTIGIGIAIFLVGGIMALVGKYFGIDVNATTAG